jgi:hypothetical protein
MTAQTLIVLARKHLTSDPSARLCMERAIECYDQGDLRSAKEQALKSLAYSVGKFSPVYLKASA